MIPVFQTRFGEVNGNCFQAALASLFELELEEVPDFCNIYSIKNNEWYNEFIKWLNQRGYSSIPIVVDNDWGNLNRPNYRGCFLLVTGKQKDGVNHCVIYKNGKCVHNPNKNCSGITPEQVDLIFPMDVCGFIKK